MIEDVKRERIQIWILHKPQLARYKLEYDILHKPHKYMYIWIKLYVYEHYRGKEEFKNQSILLRPYEKLQESVKIFPILHFLLIY